MKLDKTYWLEFTKDEVKTLYTICDIARVNGEDRANKFLKIFDKIIQEPD